ncbi:ABC transporter permease subunit [Staphylospora marina]|uniref:ABC transporter permease subunit n=1 Tax=Staphylospora marina TaxID=2490858 RepID=UPI0013DDD9D7|nr:ABC transporter permease subunit [Staphylospora marina]
MWIRAIVTLIICFCLVLCIAALPNLVQIVIDPSKAEATLHNVLGDMRGYVTGIADGKSFYYEHFLDFRGMDPTTELRSYFKEMSPLFLYSAANLSFAGTLALLSGLIVGFLLAKSGGWIRQILDFLVSVPDFAVAFVLQLSVVFIYKQTEVLIAEVYSTHSDIAYFLPFLTIFYVPFVYVVKQVAETVYQILTEDYIRTAKAKGLAKRTIYPRHVLRNVLPVIESDLYRLSAFMTGNMIVVEVLFNSPGITRFLFSEYVWSGYATRVNHLLTLIMVYLLLYLAMKGVIAALKRRYAHD